MYTKRFALHAMFVRASPPCGTMGSTDLKHLKLAREMKRLTGVMREYRTAESSRCIVAV